MQETRVDFPTSVVLLKYKELQFIVNHFKNQTFKGILLDRHLELAFYQHFQVEEANISSLSLLKWSKVGDPFLNWETDTSKKG